MRGHGKLDKEVPGVVGLAVREKKFRRRVKLNTQGAYSFVEAWLNRDD
jgi:hypothetical protein